MTANSRVRPLFLRAGARYRCFGDGVCCTDVHLLGPVTRGERKRLAVLDADRLVKNDFLGADVLATRDGRCHFLDERGCALHRDHGAASKPAGCRRFPYRLIATPIGGRVATEHRCPCCTMGDRPPIALEDAEASLRDDAGRLSVDLRVGDRIAISPRRRISFDRWCALEAQLLEAIACAEDVVEVLAPHASRAPLYELASMRWSDVAHHFRSRIDGTACGEALAWFGDVLLDLAEGTPPRRPRARPWSDAFDRAEARSQRGDPRAILADWCADVVWGLEWTTLGSFSTAATELSSRVVIAREIARRLRAIGAREDRAMAEALLIVELAGESGLWGSVMREVERDLR